MAEGLPKLPDLGKGGRSPTPPRNEWHDVERLQSHGTDAARRLLTAIAKELLKADPENAAAAESAALRCFQERPSTSLGNGVLPGQESYSLDGVTSIKELGKGTFGRVWQGTWKGGPCAIKELLPPNERHPHLATALKYNVKERAAFLEEIRNLGGLRHEHIVQLYGVMESAEGNLCMVMEYCSDGSVAEWLGRRKAARRRISVREALEIAEHVAIGLNVMQWQKLAHCDIAARNILRSGEKYKVGDLGVSQQLNDDGWGPLPGSIPTRWTAPEVFTEKRVSRTSDIWSYGVLLWEIFGYATITPFHQYPLSIPHKALQEAIISKAAHLISPRGLPDVIREQLIDVCLLHTDRPQWASILHIIRELQEDTYLCSCPVLFPDDGVAFTGYTILDKALPPEAIPRLTQDATTLNLAGLGLDDTAAKAIARAAEHMFYKKLNLSGNHLTNEGCRVLGEAYFRSSTEDVDLSHNREIGEAGHDAIQMSPCSWVRFRLSTMGYGDQCWVTSIHGAGHFEGLCFDPHVQSGRFAAWLGRSADILVFNHHLTPEASPFIVKTPGYVTRVAWDNCGGRLGCVCTGRGHSHRNYEVLIWDSYNSKAPPWKPIPAKPTVNFCFHPTVTNYLMVITRETIEVYDADCRLHIQAVRWSGRNTSPRLITTALVYRGLNLPDMLLWGDGNILNCRVLLSSDPPVMDSQMTIVNHVYTTIAARPLAQSTVEVATGHGSIINLWDLSGTKKREFTLQQQGNITGIVFSHDGTTLFASHQKEVTVWNAETGCRKFNFKGHRGRVMAVTVSPCGGMIATCGYDKRIILWSCSQEVTVGGRRSAPAGDSSVSTSGLTFSGQDEEGYMAYEDGDAMVGSDEASFL